MSVLALHAADLAAIAAVLLVWAGLHRLRSSRRRRGRNDRRG